MSNTYFWISDEQFERLRPLLPTETRGWRGSMTVG